MTEETDWDHTESELERQARLVQWLTFSRAIFLIHNDQPYFMGVWHVTDNYDEDTGMMLMDGRPTWPETGKYDRIEVHSLAEDERPDNYQPDLYREHAFETVMAIHPVEKPIEREKQGETTMLRLDQEEQITHLRLYGRLDDF